MTPTTTHRNRQMKRENETTDLSGLVAPAPVPTVDKACEQLLSKVMASQQALSEQFSKIDHPFATDDTRADYELARDEFSALIRCSIHMPQSVEGVRFLEAWHANRMEQIEVLVAHANAGNHLVVGETAEPMAISEEFAKGMRVGLLVVQAMFRDFPLALTTTHDEEVEPSA